MPHSDAFRKNRLPHRVWEGSNCYLMKLQKYRPKFLQPVLIWSGVTKITTIASGTLPERVTYFLTYQQVWSATSKTNNLFSNTTIANITRKSTTNFQTSPSETVIASWPKTEKSTSGTFLRIFLMGVIHFLRTSVLIPNINSFFGGGRDSPRHTKHLWSLLLV